MKANFTLIVLLSVLFSGLSFGQDSTRTVIPNKRSSLPWIVDYSYAKIIHFVPQTAKGDDYLENNPHAFRNETKTLEAQYALLNLPKSNILIGLGFAHNKGAFIDYYSHVRATYNKQDGEGPKTEYIPLSNPIDYRYQYNQATISVENNYIFSKNDHLNHGIGYRLAFSYLTRFTAISAPTGVNQAHDANNDVNRHFQSNQYLFENPGEVELFFHDPLLTYNNRFVYNTFNYSLNYQLTVAMTRFLDFRMKLHYGIIYDHKQYGMANYAHFARLSGALCFGARRKQNYTLKEFEFESDYE